MNKISVMDGVLYVAVGLVAMAAALSISLKFLATGKTQEPPTNVEESIPVPPAPGEVSPMTESPDSTVPGQVPGAPDSAAGPDAAPDAALEDDSVAKPVLSIEPYKYDPKNRRDPFLPFSLAPIAQGGTSGPILPLQRYDLDQLSLVGIMWEVRSPKAMFIDPTNEVHTLGKDDRIGRKNGYIAVIREGEVVVVETQQIRGELVYTTRVLKIDR